MIDKDLEVKVISTVLSSEENLLSAMQRGLTPEFFHWGSPDGKGFGATGWLFKIVTYYYQTYNSLMNQDGLQSILSMSHTITDDMKKQIIVTFGELAAASPSASPAALFDQFTTYHKHFVVLSALDKVVSSVSANKDDKALSLMISLGGDILKQFSPTVELVGTVQENAPLILAQYADQQQHPEKYESMKIGYAEWDKSTGGLRPGTLTLIIGGWKAGKSVLATNIGYNVASQGKMVYYHANEGGYTLVADRLASRALGIEYDHIKSRSFFGEEKERWVDFLNNSPISKNFHIEAVHGGSTASHLDSKLREFESNKQKVDLVIVDYLGLMETPVRGLEKHLELGQITIELKRVAESRQVPMIVLAHVNRGGAEAA
jgi:replicative DNA helicase